MIMVVLVCRIICGAIMEGPYPHIPLYEYMILYMPQMTYLNDECIHVYLMNVRYVIYMI